MKREELMFLNDIIDSISKIEKFSKGLSKEKFMKDELKQSAIIRQIEIIGEAVKNVSNEAKEKYPEIGWKNIAGARDIFIHGYFQVNFERVWDIVENNLKDLKKQIKKIKEDLEKEEKHEINTK